MFCGIAQQLPEKIGTEKNGTKMVFNYLQRISLFSICRKHLLFCLWHLRDIFGHTWESESSGLLSYFSLDPWWWYYRLFGILKKDQIENERLTCRKRCMHLGSWHCPLACQCRGRCSWKSRSGFCTSGEILPELGNDLVPVNPEVSKQLVLRQRGKSSRVCSRHLGGIILLR